MVHAKNYETMSTFGKVMQRQLLASFFPDTVYTVDFLRLLLDASLNIYTAHSTSTPSVCPVILQLTRHKNYLLTD